MMEAMGYSARRLLDDVVTFVVAAAAEKVQADACLALASGDHGASSDDDSFDGNTEVAVDSGFVCLCTLARAALTFDHECRTTYVRLSATVVTDEVRAQHFQKRQITLPHS